MGIVSTGVDTKAWQFLLQNHPHDSICGCSIDQVHRENAVRFAQSQQIAEDLIQQAMQHLVQQADTRAPFPTSHVGYEPVPIVVFNPASGPRTEEVRAEVQLPGSLQHAVIIDQHGTRFPIVWSSVGVRKLGRRHSHVRCSLQP